MSTNFCNFKIRTYTAYLKTLGVNQSSLLLIESSSYGCSFPLRQYAMWESTVQKNGDWNTQVLLTNIFPALNSKYCLSLPLVSQMWQRSISLAFDPHRSYIRLLPVWIFTLHCPLVGQRGVSCYVFPLLPEGLGLRSRSTAYLLGTLNSQKVSVFADLK